MINYKTKYLRYKEKYLNLKRNNYLDDWIYIFINN